MIEFKKLEFRNFMSFGNQITTYLFQSGITMIIGENRDVGIEGSSRNGVGKSTIFEAITYCLFGSPIDTIKLDDLINDQNSKNMFVELTLSVDGNEYVIFRGRKPETCLLTRPGIKDETTTNVQEEIDKIIGIDYEMWLNSYMLVNLQGVLPFMGMKPAAQRNFLESAVSLDIMTDRSKNLKSFNTDLTKEIAVMEERNRTSIQNNATVEANIAALVEKSDTWSVSLEEQKQELQRNINSIKEIDMNAIRKLIQDRKELETEIKELSNTINEIEKIYNSVSTDHAEKTAELESLASSKCPYCEQDYLNHEKIASVTKVIAALLDDKVTAEEGLKELVGELETLQTRFAEMDSPEYTETDLIKLQSGLDSFEAELRKLSNQTENPYTSQIEMLKGNIREVDEESVQEMKNLEKHGKFLVKLLTENKSFIRKNIVEQFVTYINTQINQRLGLVGSNHIVSINSDLTLDIDEFGKSKSYGNLSNGEKLRLNLATSLAFRDLLRMSGIEFNMIFLDELLDVGDDSFFMTTFKLMKDEGINAMLVTHRKELIGEADHVMTVVKKERFSEIIS